MLGMVIYLLLRRFYVIDDELKPVMAKAYRLLVWIIPLLLFSIASIGYFIEVGEMLGFEAWYSYDDLKWSGPFIFVFWPIANLLVLLHNLSVLMKNAIVFLGIPLLLVINVVIAVLVAGVYRKLNDLKNKSRIHFSLASATARVLAPLILFAVVVNLAHPEQPKPELSNVEFSEENYSASPA